MDQPNQTDKRLTTDERRPSTAPEPVYVEPKKPLLSQTRIGWCCLCGPGLLLLSLFVLFPFSSYLVGKFMDFHILPSGSDVLGIVGLTFVWPPLVLLMFVGIPVGIVLLNKSKK